MNDVLTSLALDKVYDTQLVETLLGLPHKMLRHYDVQALPHMLLHELGHAAHLGFKKAGYFIDSPEFDCLRGIAGFSHDECGLHAADIWHDPASFERVMQQAAFHNNVYSIQRSSLRRNQIDPQHIQDILAFGRELGMQQPQVHIWDLKRDNHGILLYEEGDKKLQDAVHTPIFDSLTGLLGLCLA